MQEIIQRAFAESGFSIKKLADTTKLPYSVAHGAITGSTDPCLSTVQKICGFLELELRPARKAKRNR